MSGRISGGTFWAPLQPGDLVDIIAPGFKCDAEGVKGAKRFLESWGLKPRIPKNLFGKDIVCANTDEARFQHLKSALLAQDSKAIWCLRGGYGSNRLVPELLKLKKPKGKPKLFIGLSDITTLHCFLNHQWGWPSVHGPMLERMGKNVTKPMHVKELQRFVFGDLATIEFKNLKPMNSSAAKKGVVSGKVVGGNLETLRTSIGTQLKCETGGRIVFFEDVGERGYRVDRILEHFHQAGYFNRARAVVFGDFTGGLEPDGKSKIPAVLNRFAENMKIPVLSGIQSGHGPVQRPLPLETPSELHLGARGTLICNTGVIQPSKRRG